MRDRGTNWLTRAISSIVLIYIILRPVSSGQILYPLLVLLGLVSFAALVFGRQKASIEVLRVIGFSLLVACYGAVVGVSNPGMLQHAAVWFLGPLLFGVWALSADLKMLRSVLFAVYIATISLSTMIILYVASELGAPSVLPAWVLEESGARFNLEGDTTAIGLYGLSSLVAAAPLSIVGAFVGNHPLLPSHKVRVLAAILATTAALLGGRNAIVLVVILVPILFLFVRLLIGLRPKLVKIRLSTVLVILSIVIALPFVLPMVTGNSAVQRTWKNVTGFFSQSGDEATRNIQIDQLLDAWSRSIVFGHGFGAVIPGYSREEERPWNFEMQYHMQLFQFGLFGILLLIVVVLLAINAILRAARQVPSLESPLLIACAGAAGIIIANATNPYLQAPGHMWAIWLPLMVANVALTSSQVQPGPIQGKVFT